MTTTALAPAAPAQPLLFELDYTIPPTGAEWFTSVSYDQNELLRAIAVLHNDCKPFELDPTYSEGVFYRKFPQPRYKFDKFPQGEGVQQADCRAIPMPDQSITSIMFDPPFVISGDAYRENPTGLICKRFTGFRNYGELEDLYRGALAEFMRLLTPGGLLVFKCQDVVSTSTQHLTHVDVVRWAEEIGFYSKDLFVLLSTSAMHDPRWKNQHHARKNHSYFLVFTKGRKRKR